MRNKYGRNKRLIPAVGYGVPRTNHGGLRKPKTGQVALGCIGLGFRGGLDVVCEVTLDCLGLVGFA